MKCAADLFYIRPLISFAFTSLDRIGPADLEFFSDILLLDDQFRNMTDEVIGVGLDLSPHYRAMLEQAGYITYQYHPDTVLGLLGRFKGLNMGVVLFRLEKMRKSKLFNNYLILMICRFAHFLMSAPTLAHLHLISQYIIVGCFHIFMVSALLRCDSMYEYTVFTKIMKM